MVSEIHFKQKNLIIEAAKSLGFSRIGFARASSLNQSAERLTQWLEMGYHGEMKNMENHFNLRIVMMKNINPIYPLEVDYYNKLIKFF